MSYKNNYVYNLIESSSEWNLYEDSISREKIVKLAIEGLSKSAFFVVQSSKILECLGLFEEHKELIKKSLSNVISKNHSHGKTTPPSFKYSNEFPSHVVLIVSDLSYKTSKIVQFLTHKRIKFHIFLIDNFNLAKPYKTSKGPWYINKSTFNDTCNMKIEPIYVKDETDIIDNFSHLLSNALGITFGTGLFNKNFISKVPFGILNIHNGLLPHVRGLDSPAWSLLLGYKYGISVHFINEHIDLGGLVSTLVMNDGLKRNYDFQSVMLISKIIENMLLNKMKVLSYPLEGDQVYPMLGENIHNMLTDLAS